VSSASLPDVFNHFAHLVIHEASVLRGEMRLTGLSLQSSATLFRIQMGYELLALDALQS
jgi:hypothetical protein